ncbi:MAG: YlxR family protein [Armatimonadetes bacterium]|nr:YlxR family protein [Armatimonadota bacterium]
MGRHVPQRVCVVCRSVRSKADLIRLQRRPSGKIAWSDTPAGGKGLYLCRTDECLARMFGEKRFRRMFVESMDEECAGRLRDLQTSTQAAAGLKEG